MLRLAFAVTLFGIASSFAEPLMCERGELLFSDDFDPATTSDRWFYRGEFALRDGALVRTEVNRKKNNQRVFLKEAAFHNTIVQFDFRFDGETSDLRLVTGSGGGYNTIVQIRPGHFQVNTASDKTAGIVPSYVGECAHKLERGKWYTITAEFFGDEIAVHLQGKHVITGTHPIIDRERKYLAFQFDKPSATIDKVRIWKATGHRNDWPQMREKLVAEQRRRPPVKRDATERYKYVHTNTKSRLTLNDANYRKLVARHATLKAAVHQRWPEAFKSHKQLQKSILATRKKLNSKNAEFKTMQTAANRARRAEDAYVVSRNPPLGDLPKHRYYSELGLARAKLEKSEDAELAKLVAQTARLQSDLEQRFPEAFAPVDELVEKRNQRRKDLNNDQEFKTANKEVAEAWKAVLEYEKKSNPVLVELQQAMTSAKN